MLSLLFFPVSVFADDDEINGLSFVCVESEHLELDVIQRVALGFDNVSADEPVVLYCVNNDSDKLVRFAVSASADGTYLFSSTSSSAGVFSLSKVEYASGLIRRFSDEVSGQVFSVGNTASLYRLFSDGGANSGPSSTFTNDSGASFDSLESAVSDASDSSVRTRSRVFVLDAGHGGWDSGAVGNNSLLEKDLTLKIARYCRDELKQYAGVRVIMTRHSDTSVTGVTNTSNELLARAQIARDNNAALYMSFHINSGGGTGAEIWIPRQASWCSSFNDLGESLGQDVLSRIASIGLVSRGTKNDYYDSGTEKDDCSRQVGRAPWGHVPGATRYAVAVRQGSGYKTYTLDCVK